MSLQTSYGFVLLGDPVQQGSMHCVGTGQQRGKGAPHKLKHNNADTLEPWRDNVTLAAKSRNRPKAPKGQPVDLVLTFSLARPANHWGTGRNAAVLKPSAPQYPTVYPDLDKLVRAICDALTGTAYADDSQVVEILARKRYAHDRALTLKPPRSTEALSLTFEDALPCPGVVIRIYPKQESADALD